MNLYACCWDAYHRAMREAKCKVAVDAGANDGGYSWTLLQNGFFVHAFEPVPKMFRLMREKIGAYDKAVLNNMGLSDVNEIVHGVTVLEAWTIGKLGDTALRQSPDFSGDPPFDMQCVTLDDYLYGRPVGIIKLDVDGYEFKVLKGAQNTIRKFKPPILCELNCYIGKTGQSEQEFAEFIFNLGYEIVSMDEKVRIRTWEDLKPFWPYHSSYDVMLFPA